MALSSTTVRVDYDGDGSTVAFPTTFVFWDADDFSVIHTDSSGTETTWTRGTQYTVTGGSGSTGTVTVSTSPTDYTPASGETLTILSALSLTQDTALPAGGAIPTSALEQQLDKIVRMVQQQLEALGRAIKLVTGSTESGVTLEDLTGNAGEFARVDSAETGIEWASITGDGDISIPVSLAEGGTNADLSSPTSLGFPRVNSGSTALEIVTTAAAADALAAGAHAIFVPAAAMLPTVSNGCAPLARVETTAGRPDMAVLDFDASSDEHAQFQIAMPSSWDEGTITFRVFWTSTATDTDGVTWALQGVACADGDTIDVAYGTAVTVDDANQSTAEDLYVTAESGAVTIAGSPAAGEMCFFRVFRDVSDANDTATEDARLIGVQIIYTVDEAFDT